MRLYIITNNVAYTKQVWKAVRVEILLLHSTFPQMFAGNESGTLIADSLLLLFH